MKLHTVLICTIHAIFLGNGFYIDIISGYVEIENILSYLYYPISHGKLTIVYLKFISIMVKGMIKNKDP